jgi:hypothetical protein
VKDRDLVNRIGAIGLIVGAVALAAALTGRSNFSFPLLGLAYWLSLIIVIRPYVYDRYGRRNGDWITVILILGPLAILVAPILWWEHRGLEPGA